LAALLTLCPTASLAHDVGVDVFGNLTSTSTNNPRAGSAGLTLNGSLDLSDAWSVLVTATYLRDFATRSADSVSNGSNIFLFSGGAMFVPTEHLMFMATALFSPPALQRNATTYEVGATSVDVVLVGNTWNLGGTFLGSWASNGLSRWEHTLDFFAAVNHFDIDQNVELGAGRRSTIVRAFCTQNPTASYCPLVNGLRSSLTQLRLGATYTATLFRNLDLAVDGAGFVYDQDPTLAGVYAPIILGRQPPDVGLGVPVAPWVATFRPSVLYRFERVSVRLAYQLGAYAGAGVNHLVSTRVSWKATSSIRLTFTFLLQSDFESGRWVNAGGTGVVGMMFRF
jgi:hypothetical protein